MAIGLLGKKLGMTHVYDEFGRRTAVTAVQAGPCTILEVRDPKRHGYQALQVGFEPIKDSKINKAQAGQFKKAGSSPFKYVREFRANEVKAEWTTGQQLTVELFQDYELVDVTGISIGKGFQGGVRRWHWKGGPATHGSTSHRAPGSIGSTTFPGRVIKGHHLPGHMGFARVTVQNLRVMKVDPQANLLIVEGAVPGPERRLVVVKRSTKRPGVVVAAKAIQLMGLEEEEKAPQKKAAAKKK